MSEARRKNGMKKWLALALNVFFASVLISCGGGGGGGVSSGDSYSSTPNTYTYSAPSSQTNPNIAVASAPSGAASSTSISISGSSANLPVISVTVCEPGNTNRCNTIPDVLLDTGSYGLRLFSSSLSLNLPQSSVAGKPLYEKTDFLSGSVWGSVVNADVYLADQKASSIPIQLIQSTFPQSMNSSTASFYTTPSALGAHGILGVGALLQDCGTSCAYSAFNSPYYTYDSASGTVTQTALPISQQIPNPVAKLSNAAYTGGIQIDLTSISANNLTATSGFVLGVPTGLPNNTVKLALNSSADFFTGYTAQTTGSSQRTLTSFIDSGSNAYFFPDNGITTCTGNSFSFYCPTSPLNLTASMLNASIVGQNNNQTIPITFTVGNYSGATTAFQPNLAGYLSRYFDWGLPFFYAHKVYVGFEQQDNSGNTIGNGYTAFSP